MSRELKVNESEWQPAHGLRKVPYRAIPVDPERAGKLRNVDDSAVNHSARVIGAHIPCCLSGRGCAQQHGQEDQQLETERGAA